MLMYITIVPSTYSRDGTNQVYPQESTHKLTNTCNWKRCPTSMKGYEKSTSKRRETAKETPFT